MLAVYSGCSNAARAEGEIFIEKVGKTHYVLVNPSICLNITIPYCIFGLKMVIFD